MSKIYEIYLTDDFYLGEDVLGSVNQGEVFNVPKSMERYVSVDTKEKALDIIKNNISGLDEKCNNYVALIELTLGGLFEDKCLGYFAYDTTEDEYQPLININGNRLWS